MDDENSHCEKGQARKLYRSAGIGRDAAVVGSTVVVFCRAILGISKVLGFVEDAGSAAVTPCVEVANTTYRMVDVTQCLIVS